VAASLAAGTVAWLGVTKVCALASEWRQWRQWRQPDEHGDFGNVTGVLLR